jgi:histone arginine demethylase JMJD6
MKWKKKMERARRLHRPSLKNWERDGLFAVFPQFVEQLPPTYQALLLPGVPHPPSLPVVLSAETLDYDFFTSTLEAKGIPCVIKDVPKVENWRAPDCWDLDTLESAPDVRNRYFKCGEDDDGCSVRVKMKHFIKYLHTNRDDSPLYIFDSAFDDDRKASKILGKCSFCKFELKD